MRLTGVKIADKTIDLTVVPLTPEERKDCSTESSSRSPSPATKPEADAGGSGSRKA